MTMDFNVGATSGGVVEETSPDMLKNTPSNIRRLANEIEQCEGRHKYLAHTPSPSDGGDVRWYFCKVPLAQNGQFMPFLIPFSNVLLLVHFVSLMKLKLDR